MILWLDNALFHLINGRWICSWMDGLAVAFDHPWWLWVPLAALVLWLAVKGDHRTRVFLAAALAAVILTDLLCAQVLKPLIARVRPCVALEGVRLLVGKKTSWSMPSNHAANLTAVAVIVGFHARRWLWLAIPVAFLTAYTRVYVGVHYPLDVLVGAAVGATVAVFVWAAAQALDRRWSARQSAAK